MNQWSYIIAAYALTWIVLGGYAVYVIRRARAAASRVAADELAGEQRS